MERIMFRVGAGRYSVRVMEAPIVLDGVDCFGICDEGRREIQLDPTLPAGRRLWTVLHELGHAHLYATGMPRDVESLCDFVATVAELAIRDLTVAGGEEALKRLSPGERFGLPTARIALTNNRYCPTCTGTLAPGSVMCQPLGDATVEVAVYCEHCDQTQTWREQATAGGLPSGVVIDGPRIEHGDKITPMAALVLA